MKYIPNILTVIRLLLVPLFINLFFKNTNAAVMVFLIACLTDIIDGYIARHFGAISKFGMLADPLADKLLQLSALVCLYISSVLPAWAVIAVLAKEFIMMVGALILLNKKIIIPSNKTGKTGTVVIAAAIVYCIAVPEALPLLKQILPYIIAGMSVLTLSVYMYLFIASNKEQSRKNEI